MHVFNLVIFLCVAVPLIQCMGLNGVAHFILIIVIRILLLLYIVNCYTVLIYWLYYISNTRKMLDS